MNTGIYAIQHVESGKRYIGSAVNFTERWGSHRHHLRRGTHHSRHLQSAWNKYGEAAFAFTKLLVCAKEHLLMYEQRCIDGYDSFNRKFGYNAAPTAGSCLGMKHTEATKAKLRERNTGRVASAETRAKLSKVHLGRKMPEWFGEFVRKMKTGTKHNEETRAKMRAARKNYRPSAATKERQSKKISAEAAARIRALYAAGGITQASIAKAYDVGQDHISRIVNNKRRAFGDVPSRRKS